MLLGTDEYGRIIRSLTARIGSANQELERLRHHETHTGDVGLEFERKRMRAATRLLREAAESLEELTRKEN